jgi:hypothetical protein
MVDRAIDLSLEVIGKTHQWSDLTEEDTSVTTTASDAYEDLPTGTWKVLHAIWSDGTSSREILLRPPKWVKENYPSPADDATNTPMYGYVENDRLYLVPEPDEAKTLKLTLLKLPTVDTGRQDQPTFSSLTYLIFTHTVSICMAILERHVTAREWMVKYETALPRAIQDDLQQGGTKRFHGERVGKAVPTALSDFTFDPLEW